MVLRLDSFPKCYKVCFLGGDVGYYRTTRDFFDFVEFLLDRGLVYPVLSVQLLKRPRFSVHYIDV